MKSLNDLKKTIEYQEQLLHIANTENERLRRLAESLEHRLAEREMVVSSFRIAAMKWLEMLERYANRNSHWYDARTAEHLSSVSNLIEHEPPPRIGDRTEVLHMEHAHAAIK